MTTIVPETVVPRFASGPVLESSPEVFIHQWLYSVVPAGAGGNFSVYLTGYCKNCRNVFSQLVPTSEGFDLVLTQTDVPKEGCVSALAGY